MLFKIPIALLIEIIIINILIRISSIFRWMILLSRAHYFRISDIFHYLNIGYLINNIFPARTGDFAKAVLLARKYNYSKTNAIASVTIERLFDIMGLGMVFIVSLFLLRLPTYLKQGSFLLFAGAATLLFLLALLTNRSKRIHDSLTQFSSNRYFLWVIRRIELVLSYSNVLRDGFVLGGALITTIIIWFLNVFTGYLIVEQISPGPYSWHVALLSLLIISISFVLPATPGNLGIYQFACVLAFSIAAMPKEPAILYSLISQIPVYIFNVVLGFYSMSHESIQRKSLQMDAAEDNNS